MEPRQRRRLRTACLVLLALTIPTVLVWRSPIGGYLRLVVKHHSLTKRDDLPEIASTMRALMRDPGVRNMRVDDPDFPRRFADMGAIYLSSSPERVSIEFGGGFYHYGYRLEKASESELRFVCYGEYPEDSKLLLTLPVEEPIRVPQTKQATPSPAISPSL